MLKKLCAMASFIIITSLCPSVAKAAIASKETTPKTPYNWSGFYVGAHIGGAFGKANPETTTRLEDPAVNYFNSPMDVAQVRAAGSNRLDPNSFISGAQAGYNYQRRRFVLGLETDFDYFGLDRSQSTSENYNSLPSAEFTLTHHVRTKWLYTLRPRIGYSLGRFLVYGTGGMALSRIAFSGEFQDDNGGTNYLDTSASRTALGWVVGGGLEYGITQNWSVKSEYLYINFHNLSRESTFSAIGTHSPLRQEIALEAHVIRLGINYRF